MMEYFAGPVSFLVSWTGVFVFGELLAMIVFGYVRAIHVRQKTRFEWEGDLPVPKSALPSYQLSLDYDWLKGVLERLVLSVGLLAGFVHILTFFGALKIATGLTQREKGEQDRRHAWSMDYFLTGNLVSALFAILYVLLIQFVQPLIFHILL